LGFFQPILESPVQIRFDWQLRSQKRSIGFLDIPRLLRDLPISEKEDAASYEQNAESQPSVAE
jgi:hypothetical protein